MPEPLREYYPVVAFDHKVLIFGGSNGANYLRSVLQFDLLTNEFKVMPSLPNAVSEI